MFLEVRNALVARLTGQSPSDVAQRLGASGMRSRKRGTPRKQDEQVTFERVGTLQAVDALPLDVPVVPYSLEGTGFRGLPVISVSASTIGPRGEDYLFSERLEESLSGNDLFVDTPSGTVQGPGLRFARKQPRTITYGFQIRIWARNDSEAAIIYERVVELLDQKGYLAVTLRDGSEVTYDTSMADEPTIIDVPPGIVQDDDDGEYSIVINYQVEGYLDNTHTKTMERTVAQREFSVSGTEPDAYENTPDVPYREGEE